MADTETELRLRLLREREDKLENARIIKCVYASDSHVMQQEANEVINEILHTNG